MRRQYVFLAERGIVPFFVTLVLLWTSGCAEKQQGSDVAVAAMPSPGQLTDEDYLKFANFLEKAAQSGDVEAFTRAIDWDAIISRATTPSVGSKEFNEFFVLTTMRDVIGSYGIAEKTVALVKDGGEFRCLRVHTVEGTKRLVFRLLVPKKPALDYFEFELARRADGRVLVSDYYVFRIGETISQAIRRKYRSIATVAQKVLERNELSAQEMAFAENHRKFLEMEACSCAGDGQRALEINAQLPAAFQKEKFVLLTRLEAANLVGGKAYDDAMEAIRSALPDDPCVDFVLVDYYTSHQQYDELRAAIDRLDRRIEDDSYQDARRALSYLQEKKYKLAREHGQKALDAEDTLLLAYCVLLQCAIEEKDFDEVSRLLTVTEEKAVTTVSDLTTIPIYAEFVKSPQYQSWLKKARPGGTK